MRLRDKARAQYYWFHSHNVDLLSALLRQSNPNWDAYFFVTDDHLFDDELKVILSKYGDIRLKYLEIAMKFRPKVH